MIVSVKEKLCRISHLYLFVFVLWGLYRLIFRFPENIEEIILKPLVWLSPTFYLVFRKEKRSFSSLGYSSNTFKSGIAKGLGFSLLFLAAGIGLNYFKTGHTFSSGPLSGEVLIPSLMMAFITAISEETVFRGYLFNRLNEIVKNHWVANVISSLGFCLIHLPISIFVFHYNPLQLVLFFSLIFLSSLGSGLLFFWTGSIWGSIFIHVFWSWPVMLFK